jgi:hypothetical protein
MKDGACIMVYGDDIYFFFAILPKIPIPKHREIQEFGQKVELKFRKFT